MKIFAMHDDSGCGFYRVKQPMTYLAKYGGHEVKLQLVSGDGMRASKAYGWPIIEGQRLDRYEALSYWRRYTAQSKLVYEIDDDVFTVEQVNWQAYGVYSRPDIQDAVKHYCEVAHLVTVTTESLAEVMRPYNDNVAVLPNHIPGYVCDLPNAERKTPVVGWVGGSSHSNDFAEVGRPLRRFLDRFPGWEVELRGTDYRPALRHDRGRFKPWIDINESEEEYYSSLNFDIGIAPLAPGSAFNRSKSHIKALEYAARGIPIIASDMAPYRDFVIHGETGFLVRRDHEWLKYLSDLASDEQMRIDMGKKARDVARNWTMEDGWHLWEQAYERLNARCE